MQIETEVAGRKLRDWLEYTIQMMVDQPAEVEATMELGNEDRILLTLRTAPEDIGKVIGKQGRLARAMRSLMGAMAMKLRVRYELNIVNTGADERGVQEEPCLVTQA